MELNSKVKSLWLAALRSGKYAQDTGSLQGPDGFCCLGVLEDVYRDEKGFDPDEFWDYDRKQQATVSDGCKAWSGLGSVLVDASKSKYTDSLIKPDKVSVVVLNDDMRATFDEIADMIEAST